MKRHLFSRLFTKNDEIFCMAKLVPRESKLNTRLYLDDAATYKNSGHWKRIKFQHDNTVVDPRDWCPMDFEGNVRNDKGKYKIKISQSEINRISNFVRNNIYALNALCDIQDFTRGDFVSVMIPDGNIASEEAKLKQKEAVDKILKEIV